MKNYRLTALLLALLMMLTCATSFAAAEADPVVITAGRHSVLLSEAQSAVDELIAQYESYFTQYGYSLTQEELEYVRDTEMESLAMYCVMDNIAEDKGYNVISDAEKEEIKTEAQASYDEAYAYVKDYYVTNYGLSETEADKYAAQGVEEAGYSLDELCAKLEKALPYDKIYDEATKDVAVSEDEIKAFYQEKYVAPDEESYANDVYNYELSKNYYGTTTYYVPEGYRAVTHILLGIPEDVQAELDACEEKMDAAQTVADGFVDELNTLEVEPEEGAEPVEHRAAEEIQADIDKANADLEALGAEFDAIRAKTIPALQSKIDEIYAKIDAGEDFDSLIATYGEDPGMASNPEGYQVHADSVVWAEEFRDGAMAIEAVGGVSEPVLSDFGVHIIKYVSDVPAGAVELTGELYDTMSSEALTQAQTEAFQKCLDEWYVLYPVTMDATLIVLPEVVAEEPAAEATATN